MDLNSNHHGLEVLYCVWKYYFFYARPHKESRKLFFFINQMSHFNSMRKPATLNSR